MSTNKDDQANSFETQQRFFREYAAQNPEWELYKIYADEGISGTGTKKRAQFNSMIQDAYEGKFRMILTKEVSRFSRNILDTISYTRELRSVGVGVMFLTDRINTLEPESEMLLSFLASLAQEESRRTSTRVVWGQTRQMERGVVFGRSMLGYDVKNGTLYIEPEGAELVQLIFQKYTLEQIGTTQIARFLTDRGYRTHWGSTKWTPSAVVKILKNEKYAGDLVQKKSYTPDYLTHEKRQNRGQVPLIKISDHHEPIISREMWELAQARLIQNNKHEHVHPGHSNRYVFSGKIKCGVCGSVFVGRVRYLKGGTAVRRWCCGTVAKAGASACNVGRVLRDDDAMQMLLTAIRSLQIDRTAVICNVTALAISGIYGGDDVTADGPVKLQYEINRTQKKKESVMDSYFSGEISREDMLAMKKTYENRIESLGHRLIDTKKTKDKTKELRLSIQTELQSILAGEIESEVFCKTLLESLTVYQDRHIELRLCHLPECFIFEDG